MHLGLPCQLMGTGMAFPWRQIAHSSLASGRIAEDVALGLQLALDGHPPQFHRARSSCRSRRPTAAGRNAQRTRWVHGYLSVLREYLFKLIAASIGTRNLAVLALALDLAVPPLSVLVLAAGISFFASATWFLVSGALAPIIASLLLNLGFGALSGHRVGILRPGSHRAGGSLASLRDMLDRSCAWSAHTSAAGDRDGCGLSA